MGKNNNILTNKKTKKSKIFIKWMYKKDNINYKTQNVNNYTKNNILRQKVTTTIVKVI